MALLVVEDTDPSKNADGDVLDEQLVLKMAERLSIGLEIKDDLNVKEENDLGLRTDKPDALVFEARGLSLKTADI